MSPEVREPRNRVPVDRTGAEMPDGQRSPVDEILAAPTGKSLLDTKPSEGPVPKWLWLLPFVLLLPGGIVGWLIVRGTNRAAGRMMLIIGLVMTVLTVLSIGPISKLAMVAGS